MLNDFSFLSFYIYQELAGHYGEDDGLSSKYLSSRLHTNHDDMVLLLEDVKGVEHKKMTDGSLMLWLPADFSISKWHGPN